MSRFDPAACHRLAWTAIIAAAAFAPPTAFAADPTPSAAASNPPSRAAPRASAKPREGSLGKGTSTAPLLTRDQLRQCLADSERLKQETADMVQAQRTLDKDRAEFDRLGVELETEKATLDRSSQAAVDGYNERARQRAKMLDDYRAAAPAFNLRVDKLDAARQAYAKDCADRRYFEDDLDAIKAGK